MDDQNTPSEPVAETPVQAPEPAPTPVEPESSQPNGSTPTDLPPEAPESPISVPAPIPVESQNGGVNQPESEVPEASNQAPIPEPFRLSSAICSVRAGGTDSASTTAAIAGATRSNRIHPHSASQSSR